MRTSPHAYCNLPRLVENFPAPKPKRLQNKDPKPRLRELHISTTVSTMKTFLSLCLLTLVAIARGDTDAMHPLDSLSASELKSVVTILGEAGYATSTTRYSQISLDLPDKALVKTWQVGDELFSRRAVAYIKDEGVTYKGIVDLLNDSVVSYEKSDGERTCSYTFISLVTHLIPSV